MKLDDVFWVQTVAITVFVACIVGIVVYAIGEKKRTGHLPRDLYDSRGKPAWFFALLFTYIAVRDDLFQVAVHHFPLNIVVPGIDIGLLIALIAVGVWAIAYAVRSRWCAALALWIFWHLLLPVVFVLNIGSDLAIMRISSRVWIPVAVIALVAAPFLTRFAFTDAAIGGEPRDNMTSPPGMRSFRLWRPGDPK